MHATSPEESLKYWRQQRIALLQYIEDALKSGEGNEIRQARLMALRAGIMKIDAEILRLEGFAFPIEKRSP